jgi:23S rRNA pseudouridine2605 synthase
MGGTQNHAGRNRKQQSSAHRPEQSRIVADSQAETSGDTHMRLNRFLARAGVASRRTSDKFIQEGRVQVNGQTVGEMGVVVDTARDTVAVDGRPVVLRAATVMLVLNKPAGVYTTMSDPQGRPCVADYVNLQRFPGIYHVGRLDRDTTGLLFFTNDGRIGNQLMHPAHHVDKTYIAQVEGTPSAVQLRRLNNGVDIKVGARVRHTAPAEVDLLSREQLNRAGFDVRQSCLEPQRSRTSFVQMTIHQGMKHQVKLMLGAVGHPVVNLHRVSFGPLSIGDLPLGKTRALTSDEVAALRKAACLDSHE